jgi:hypothetical protein
VWESKFRSKVTLSQGKTGKPYASADCREFLSGFHESSYRTEMRLIDRVRLSDLQIKRFFFKYPPGVFLPDRWEICKIKVGVHAHFGRLAIDCRILRSTMMRDRLRNTRYDEP